MHQSRVYRKSTISNGIVGSQARRPVKCKHCGILRLFDGCLALCSKEERKKGGGHTTERNGERLHEEEGGREERFSSVSAHATRPYTGNRGEEKTGERD